MDVVCIAELEVDEKADEDRGPQDAHNEVNCVQARVQRARSIEVGAEPQEVDAAREVQQDDRLVAHRELRVLDQVLVRMTPSHVDKVRAAHGGGLGCGCVRTELP